MTRTKGLTATALKTIAIAAMTADHVAWLLFPGYDRHALPLILHLIGRLTCPVMCFFVAEGYHYTHDVKKYTRRLLLLALVSHFAYVLASADFVDAWSFLPLSRGSVLNQTGVVWSLAGGLIMLRINGSRWRTPAKVLGILAVAAATFPADWSCIAALCILSIGANRGHAKKQIAWCLFYVGLYALVYCLALDVTYGLLQLGVALAIPLLKMYNGRLGDHPRAVRWMKTLFYVYYPLHLAILGLIGLAMR